MFPDDRTYMTIHAYTVSEEWSSLLDILKNTKAKLEELADWENKKSKAIIDRDKELLDHCNREQETLSKDLDHLEKGMLSLCAELSVEHQQPKPSSLGAMLIWHNLPIEIEDELDKLAAELQMLLSAIHLNTENNQKLLKDSVNFFQTMIEALSGEEKLGYGSDGLEKPSRTRQNLLVDLNC